MADPGVEDGVEEVDGEVDQHEGGADEDYTSLHHEVVVLEDAPDDGVAEALHAEDALDDERPADELTDADAGDGEEREARGSQGVPEQDVPGGHPLGLGHPDVVLLEG